MVVISEEPPEDTSGSGTPMTGSRPMTDPMLTMAWMTIHAMIPAETIRTNVVRGPGHQPEAGKGEQAEQPQDDEGAQQAELLADDGEDEVGVRLGR